MWLNGEGGRLVNQSPWLAWVRIPARSDMCSTPLPSRSLWAALGQLGKAENGISLVGGSRSPSSSSYHDNNSDNYLFFRPHIKLKNVIK